MNRSLLTFILASAWLCLSAPLSGQEADSVKAGRPVHQVGVDVMPAHVFPTNSFLKGDNLKHEKIDKTASIHLKYAFRFPRTSRFGKIYPHAYQGVGVAYNTFYNAAELGDPLAVYVFQGSRIKRLLSRLSLDYEWNFGVSFGWKPYDENHNVANIAVGSRVNAYINLGFYLNWQVSPQWRLMTGVAVTHYSNGNTRYPNSGVNVLGVRVGMTRVFGAGNSETASHAVPRGQTAEKPRVVCDVVAYGAQRTKGIVEEGYLVPGKFGIAGMDVNAMYAFNPYFRVGLSADGHYDESANIKTHIAGRDDEGEIKFYRPPLREQIGVGLSLRAELTMPVFSINFGVGHSLLGDGDDLEGYYQVLILKTDITRRLFLHTGYKLKDFRHPGNLMLGLGYRIAR